MTWAFDPTWWEPTSAEHSTPESIAELAAWLESEYVAFVPQSVVHALLDELAICCAQRDRALSALDGIVP